MWRWISIELMWFSYICCGGVAQENTSVVVEVRLRPPYAQWRYRLDVIVDQRYIYFDTFSRHVQNFKGLRRFFCF